jgi:CHAD domain-containing protein
MADERDAASRLSSLRGLALPMELGRRVPAGAVLRLRVRDQAEALLEAELTIRAGEAQGVHDARVACRRLRAALATFRPAVRDVVSEPLRNELRWLARSLGEARDQDMVRVRLLALADQEGLDAGLFIDRVGAQDGPPLDDPSVLAALASHRCGDLLDALEDFVADPPWTAGADRDAGPFLRRRIRKEWQRLEGRVSPVADLEPGTAPDHELHDVRKAAKRLRYALEVAEPLWPKKAKRLRKRVHALTDILGERQDTVLTRAELLRVAAQCEAAGEPAVAADRLHEIEEARAAQLEEQFQGQWSETVQRLADHPLARRRSRDRRRSREGAEGRQPSSGERSTGPGGAARAMRRPGGRAGQVRAQGPWAPGPP